MKNTVRLQVEMDKEHMEEFEELLKLGGLRTKRDLLNNALTLLKWAAREKAKGNSICSVGSDGQLQKELELPLLEAIAVSVTRAATAAARATQEPTASTLGSDSPSIAAVMGSGPLRLLRGN